jgi:hypothetical protein
MGSEKEADVSNRASHRFGRARRLLERSLRTVAALPGCIFGWLLGSLVLAWFKVKDAYDDWGYACGPLFGLVILLLIGLIIALVVWVIHGAGQWWHWLTSHF